MWKKRREDDLPPETLIRRNFGRKRIFDGALDWFFLFLFLSDGVLVVGVVVVESWTGERGWMGDGRDGVGTPVSIIDTACAAPSSSSTPSLGKRVQFSGFTAGWDWHSFARRDWRRYAFAWIRYLQKSPATSDWLYVNVLRPGVPSTSLLFSSGLLSALASAALVQLVPRTVSTRHGTTAEAIAPGPFHPALPSDLGNQ